MEVSAFALQPVVVPWHPADQIVRVEHEQERQVRQEPADRRQVELEHTIEPETARDALIGDGRVDVAVAENDLTSCEGGPDDLLHVLRPRRRIQRGLGPRRHVPPVQDKIANPLAELRATGLTRRQVRAPVRLEALREQPDLRRLARSVEPFERDEHASPNRRPIAGAGDFTSVPPMRVVVTGGAGFIGSHVVDALVARSNEVHVLDNLSTGSRDFVSAQATLHEGDIRTDAAAVFEQVEPDVCFHLAAQADVGTSVQRPGYDAEVNVVGTISVLEAARTRGAQVVFSSTGGAIYGECTEPAGEDSPRRPVSPYGMAKLSAEEYLAGWNRLYGTGHVALRFANVYGPRQAASLEGGVVAIFLERLAAHEPTTIFGDGEQSRDFVYVKDVVRGVLAAVGHDGGVFNLGTGVATTVNALHEACRRTAGSSDGPMYQPARAGDALRSVVDPSRARSELGWQAEVSLDDGLRETWESLRKE